MHNAKLKFLHPLASLVYLKCHLDLFLMQREMEAVGLKSFLYIIVDVEVNNASIDLA